MLENNTIQIPYWFPVDTAFLWCLAYIWLAGCHRTQPHRLLLGGAEWKGMSSYWDRFTVLVAYWKGKSGKMLTPNLLHQELCWKEKGRGMQWAIAVKLFWKGGCCAELAFHKNFGVCVSSWFSLSAGLSLTGLWDILPNTGSLLVYFSAHNLHALILQNKAPSALGLPSGFSVEKKKS